jgi:23S rRNA (cytosine1962-C5)-methyltransferase
MALAGPRRAAGNAGVVSLRPLRCRHAGPGRGGGRGRARRCLPAGDRAAASGLDDRPIRWLCEDAATFVTREARRGSTYAGVVLDPPSWGHGPRGQPFAIDADLVPLVHATVGLLTPAAAPGPILLTCHSPGWNHARLRATLAEAFAADGRPAPALESGPLTCRDDTGRDLELGSFARGPTGGPAEAGP